MTAIAEKTWNGWRVARWSIAAALLMTPLVGMQFSADVKWSVSDFVFAAVMIGGTGLLYELAASRSGSWPYRMGVAFALAASFLIVWINLAVGIVGNEDNPANLSFFGLIAMAAVASFAAGFSAKGMARAMACVGAAQALLGVMVATAPINATEPPGPAGLLGLNLAFALVWIVSAALFRRAAQTAG